jgi:hypothetical protein
VCTSTFQPFSSCAPEAVSRRSAGAGVRAGLFAVVLAVTACSGPPPTVERITIINPTGYDLDVEVTGQDRDSWLPVAIVEAGTEDIAQDVIDQGDVWIFRFKHFGDPIEELRLTRAELEGSGWRVEVPPEVGERLQELGRPTSEELTGVEPGGGR